MRIFYARLTPNGGSAPSAPDSQPTTSHRANRSCRLPMAARWGALLVGGWLVGLTAATAQTARPAPGGLTWPAAPASRAALNTSPWAGRLTTARTVAPDAALLRATLAAAPLEGTPGVPLVISLPTPDGGLARFQLVEAPVMEPGLAAQFPDIHTYAGVGLDDPTATLRADVTLEGFHAQVLSRRDGGTFYIDPIQNTDFARGLVVYDKRNLLPVTGQRMVCQTGAPGTGTTPTVTPPAGSIGPVAQRVTTSLGGTLRTYRLAVAATGEYTAFHGGTVAGGQAAIVTSVNRVTGVYEKELAVRLVLIANNSSLVYTNASTDPYANTSNDLAANQSNITTVIGSANYDIGHLVGTGGGGIAGLGVVCTSSQKARGLTGSPSPVNDAFDIDYVAHEMGHQFGGNHPFNGSVGSCSSTNRNASTAWEPGSGSTIMAYAGICDGSGTGGTGTSQDLQPHSDAYFHGGNISEMTTFITGTSCPTSASSGNTPPTVGTPAAKSLPASTPFRLTATASDTDGDALTYDWEEMDLGSQGAPVTASTTQTANATPPLFRSWNPDASPTRYFPRLNELRNNTVAYGEYLPTVARAMKFVCTVRDQHFSSSLSRIVGGVNQSGTLTLTVVNTGAAFAVTSPNAAGTFSGATTVTWNVAGTTANGINCASVDILLSTDGGLTFPTTLVSGVSNSGSASVTLPNLTTSTARVMVAAADNYFFDISNANFSITPANPNSPTITSIAPTSGPVGTSVTITGTNLTGVTAVSFNGTAATTFTTGTGTSLTATVPAGATTGSISVTTPNGIGSSTTFTVLVAPTITSFSPTSGVVGTSVTITGTGFSGTTAVAFNGTSATFTVGSATSITATVPAGATTGTISVTNPLGTVTSGTSFTVVAAPANDLCTAANLPVLQCGIAVTGTTANATTTGDPTATCTTSITAPGVFYRFLGTGGPVTISTCGAATTYDTKLYVFTGSCGSYTCVIGNDDVTCGSQTTTSTVTFTSVAGTNYYVFVAGYQTNTGPFTLLATCGSPAPTITSFSPTAVLPGNTVTITGTNLTGASAVSFNGAAATSFTGVSATSVTAVVSAAATTGPITVTTGTGATTGQVVSATSLTVNHPPVIGGQTFSVAENSAVGTAVGTVAATDADAGQSLSYAITAGNTGGAFALNAATGALTVNAAILNFEATPTYTLTVSATDNGTPVGTASATITVNLTNVNESPVIAAQSFSVAENSAVGTAVGTVTASDPDAATTLSYAITAGNTGGAFAINAATGALTVNNAALDFETTPSYALTVAASDGALASSATITVGITNVNEAPAIAAQAFSVAENSAVGTAVGTVVASDPDAGQSLAYAITGGNTGGAFALNASTGALTVNAAILDFETTPTYSLTVTATDNGSPVLASSATITVNLTNVNETPVIAAQSFSVAENSAVGTAVGSVAASDQDASTSLAYAITTGNGSGAFALNATTGALTVNAALLNFETTPSYSLTVQVTDNGSPALAASATMTVSITNVVEQPTITSFSPASGPVGTVVTLTGSNYNTAGAVAVAFNGTPATSVSVASATSLTATVPAGATSGFLTVTNSDGTGTSATSFSVTVPAPVIVSVSPGRNARSASASANALVTFDQAMSATAALRVFGGQTGQRAGATTASGTSLAFDPASNFRPGELVSATVTSAAQATAGGTLAKGQVWQFTAAAGAATGIFTGATNPAVGASVRATALADVDGDGDLDLLSALGAAAGSVSIRLNNGAGSYSGTGAVAVGGAARALAVGDVDGDGDADVVTANSAAGANSVSVRLNNGAGTFSGTGTVAVGTTPYDVELADVDADGDLDLLAANFGGASVSIRLNDGTGAFSGTGVVSVGASPFALAVGDVDNDGDVDVVTASYAASGTLSVRLNDGTGAFSGSGSVAVGINPVSVQLADVDGDGDVDALASNYGATTVSVRVNDGAGTFSGTQNVAVGAAPYTLSVGDVDGDGDVDFVVANYSANTLAVRLNDGSGTFGGSGSVATAAGPMGTALGDVDGDGDLDAAVGNYTAGSVSIRFNQNPPPPAPTVTGFSPVSGPVGTSVTLTGTSFTGAASVTFNGTAAAFSVGSATSITTSVPAGATSGTIAVTTATGTGTSATSFTVTVGGSTPPVIVSVSPGRNARSASASANALVTFDQAMSATAALRVFGGQTGQRAGATTASGTSLAFDPASNFRPGELVSATVTSAAQATAGGTLAKGQVWQFTAAAGAATGIFTGATNPAVGASVRATALADVDGDGDLDLLSALGAAAGSVSIRLNNGAGSYSGTGAVAVGGAARALAVGDVDGDGDADVVTANSAAGANSVSVRLNNGAGTFSGTGTVAVGTTPYDVELADVDADGDLDLLAANFGGASVSIRLNDGTGAFSGTGVVSVGASPFALAVGDVDNDGDVDVVTASYAASGTLSVRLNDGTGAFSGSGSVAVGINPVSVQLADVDGDGDVDALASNYGATTVSVRVNDGAGTFSGTQNVAVGAAPYTLSVGDVDGDGDVDFVVANYSANTLAVRLNDGSGTFGGSGSVATAAGPMGTALGDVDGDGDLDAAVGNFTAGSVSIRFNQNLARPAPNTQPDRLPVVEWALSPNPASERVRLELLGSEAPALLPVVITDALGREVSRTTLPAGERDLLLDVRLLAPGVYVVHAAGQAHRLIVGDGAAR